MFQFRWANSESFLANSQEDIKRHNKRHLQHLSAWNQVGRAVPIALWRHTLWIPVKSCEEISASLSEEEEQVMEVWSGWVCRDLLCLKHLEATCFYLFLMKFINHLNLLKNNQETNAANPAGTKSSWHCGLSRFSRCFNRTSICRLSDDEVWPCLTVFDQSSISCASQEQKVMDSLQKSLQATDGNVWSRWPFAVASKHLKMSWEFLLFPNDCHCDYFWPV